MESLVFFCSVNDTSAAAHSHSRVLLSVFKMCFDENVLSLQTKTVSFVQTLQNIVKLNSNTMARPGGGDW
jgi:hypothetical protein